MIILVAEMNWLASPLHHGLNQAYQQCGNTENIPDCMWTLTVSRLHESRLNFIVLAFAELDFEETSETNIFFLASIDSISGPKNLATRPWMTS